MAHSSPILSGILAVDKPLGWTSHDVVARIRRVAAQRQVGHAGTLDPLATGVLLLVLGRATRLSSYLMAQSKTYCAEVVLGATTATDDGEAPLARWVDVGALTREQVERCLSVFRGKLRQVPPAYAAVKQRGEKLYVLARKGEAVAAEPREVVVHDLEIVHWQPPRLRLRVRCGSGTYVRSLARDIGSALGVGAYLHALRRVSSAGFAVGECHPLNELGSREAVARSVLPADRAVLDRPAAVLPLQEVRAVCAGRPISLPLSVQGTIRLYDDGGTLVALGEGEGRRVKPFRVFEGEPEPDARGG